MFPVMRKSPMRQGHPGSTHGRTATASLRSTGGPRTPQLVELATATQLVERYPQLELPQRVEPPPWVRARMECCPLQCLVCDGMQTAACLWYCRSMHRVECPQNPKTTAQRRRLIAPRQRVPKPGLASMISARTSKEVLPPPLLPRRQLPSVITPTARRSRTEPCW